MTTVPSVPTPSGFFTMPRSVHEMRVSILPKKSNKVSVKTSKLSNKPKKDSFRRHKLKEKVMAKP